MATQTSPDTAPIVAEIGRARTDFAVAVEALASRIAPKKLMEQAKLQLATKVAHLKQRLNPVQIVKRKLSGSRPGEITARSRSESGGRLALKR